MNPLVRLDGNLAEMMSLLCKGLKLKKPDGSDFKASDLMRWGATEPDEPATIEEAFGALMNARIR